MHLIRPFPPVRFTVAGLVLFFVLSLRAAERAPTPRPDRTERGPRMMGGAIYEGKNPTGATISMEFLDAVRVHVTVSGAAKESFDGFYFAKPDGVLVVIGSEKVTWTRKGDALETKSQDGAVTQLIKKADGSETDPAAVAALAGTKYTGRNSTGKEVTVEFLEKEKARLTFGERASSLEGTYRATTERIVVTVGGNAFVFTRSGDALEATIYDAKPTRFVKE